MIPGLRNRFNAAFDEATYDRFVEDLKSPFPGALDFRIAETPLFVPSDFKEQMLSACEHIIDRICSPVFREQSEGAIPAGWRVPGPEKNPHWLMFDFAVCRDPEGGWVPRLIELQGFPTIYAFKIWHDELIRRHFSIPHGLSCYLSGFDMDGYLNLLCEMIVGDEDPSSVILLEIFPQRQGTRIDFHCFTRYLGIPVVCLTELEREGRHLFYRKEGKRVRVRRIFNRIIFDELQQQSPEVLVKGRWLTEELEVDWVTHPNWFYRVSKHMLPSLRHSCVPDTRFLSDVGTIPEDLHNHVLKPLFSFAAHGVILEPSVEDIKSIRDPQNWILQRKVAYGDALAASDGPVKAEIRLNYFWPDGDARPTAVSNLVRLSKGPMIGLRFNKDKKWVGSSLAYFET